MLQKPSSDIYWSSQTRKTTKIIKLKTPVSCMTLVGEDVWWMEDNKLCQVSAAKVR